jgi:integrase
LLLVRLGLRCREVAAMLLEDIDWRAGWILVRGKGGRHDRLPLPADVGAALAGYLQHRPPGDPRAVFVAMLS